MVSRNKGIYGRQGLVRGGDVTPLRRGGQGKPRLVVRCCWWCNTLENYLHGYYGCVVVFGQALKKPVILQCVCGEQTTEVATG